MRDITKYTIELTVEALNENEDRIPIIADNPLLDRYPHGYYEPGNPPVSITPALAPTLETELNADGSLTDITVPELAYENTDTENTNTETDADNGETETDTDTEEGEETTGQYVSQTVNPVFDDPELYIEWFNEVINGYTIDPDFNPDDVDTDFEYDNKNELNTDEITTDEFAVDFIPAEEQQEQAET